LTSENGGVLLPPLSRETVFEATTTESTRERFRKPLRARKTGEKEKFLTPLAE
jgi:hypothetical protein